MNKNAGIRKNVHWEAQKKVIQRDIYLNKLISKKHNGLIKVVTGVRRCGKSFLLFHLFKDHLLSKGMDKKHIIEMRLVWK